MCPVPDENRLDAVEITVDDRPLAAELYSVLTLVRVEESVQLPDTFAFRFDDPNFELFDANTFSLGTRVAIAFRAEGELVTVTNGEVTAISVEQGPGGLHELVVTGLDATHRLFRVPRTRSFVQMTDADIATQVAGEHGLDADVGATGEVHPYVLQAGQSDGSLLADRARRIGFDVWITDRTLHYKPRPQAAVTPPKLVWGENLHRFRVRFSCTDRCDEVMVRGWDPSGKRVLLGRATEGDTGTTAPAATDLNGSARRAFGRTTRVATHFPVSTQGEADALASSLLLRATGGEVVARGEASGDPLLAAGAEVTVDRMGERMSGRYVITSVTHSYGSGSPYVSRFECGGKEPASLVDLAGVGGAASGGRRDWRSVVIGVVTNCDDPERLGRVKVKFPTLSDDDESAWGRTVSPGGGPSRGLQCLHEVGDEVAVAFEHGDPDRPVILGGLWSSEDPPPDRQAVANGKVDVRVWASRSGHRLELDDRPDGRVTLALGDGDCSLALNRAESTLTGVQRLVVEGQEVDVTAHRKLTLKAPQIEIAADAEVKVSGGIIRLN